MKVALLTPPAGAGSRPAADEVRALLPSLAERLELTLFAEAGSARDAAALEDHPLHDVATLQPTAFDQVVAPVDDDAACGFMLPVVRRVGGVAVLFGWSLAHAARAAYPGLDQEGALGRWLGVREGGPAALRREPGAPALNRSVVRYADAFLLPSDALRQRVLDDRNEPTPIEVVDPRADVAERARAWARALERFPTHRAGRKSLVRSFFDALRGHAASRAAERRADRGPSGA